MNTQSNESEKRTVLLSYLLLASSAFNFAAALIAVWNATGGFELPLPVTGESSKITLTIFTSGLLIAANLTYQLVLRKGIPFSEKMLVGFVVGEILFSWFVLTLKAT
jgi:hypothetical protein